MSFNIYIQQAIANIISHPLRSFLTLLGVLVGTAAVVALLTGSKLATQSALDQFKRLGTDLFSVTLNKAATDVNKFSGGFSLEQLPELNSPDILIKAPYTMHYSTIFLDTQKFDLSTVGVTEELQKILKLEVEKGRFISNLDNNEFYCVVGNKFADELGSGNSVIGKQIRINSNYFTIIGILKPAEKNLFLFADTNQSIFIPIKTSLLFFKHAEIKNIIFKINSEKKNQVVQNSIQERLHFLFPEMQINFSSPETIIHNMEQQNRIFTLLLAFIGSIALLVGGIGVMNIMLVSVTERRREIGIRMAVGANNKDILMLFLIEASVLTFLGGIIGTMVGECIAFVTAKFSHWNYELMISPILTGFSVSVLIGLFFGYYPAQKASQLDPIVILRGD